MFSAEPLLFATNNRFKFIEARAILAKHKIEIRMLKAKTLEVQHEDLRRIVLYSARYAWERARKPLIVEDAGLFINALSGFPGPYSSYVYKTIGIDGILKLMKGKKDRKASFSSAVAYVSSEREVKVFVGKVEGKISEEPKGKGGFGFDPIFLPKKSGLTFAEMSTEEKNLYSHRAMALDKFARWYKKSIAASS